MTSKADQIFLKINLYLLSALLMSMFLLVVINVIGRYFFSTSLNWAEELSRFLMISTCFLGAGVGMREGRHVAIELVFNLIKNDRIRYLLKIFDGIIVLLFLGVVSYLGFLYAFSQMGTPSTVLRWDMGIFYLILPIGMILFICHFILTFRNYIKTTSIEEFVDQKQTEEGY